MSDNFWGDLIRTLRTEQGISQRILSARAKVNRSTLRRVEAGTTDGHIGFMERVLDYLGYELEAIVVDPQRAKKRELAHNPDKRSNLAVHRIMSMDM